MTPYTATGPLTIIAASSIDTASGALIKEWKCGPTTADAADMQKYLPATCRTAQ